MLAFTIYSLLMCLLAYLFLATLYQVVLAAAYFIVRDGTIDTVQGVNHFAIIVPAHNEELLISKTLDNLLQVKYPEHQRDLFIIADNCNDQTAEIASSYAVTVLTRKDTDRMGKGFALEWALQQIDLDQFDAVLILDADTTVDRFILSELDKLLNKGEQAIQCYIKVPNRSESWFTQLIYVSRIINDRLYHYSKYKLGLSSYLMGTGMCFKTDLLRAQTWSAFTIAEDWEYFAHLINRGTKVAFALKAIVLQQESKSLKQATTQRLRWSKGRFYVVKNLGLNLLIKGLRTKNWIMADASLALLFPNWSLQINLILLALFASLMLPASSFKSLSLSLSIGMLTAQGIVLMIGALLAGDYWSVFKAILIAPLFLIWKFAIDFVSMTGIYKGKKWIRTERHISKDDEK